MLPHLCRSVDSGPETTASRSLHKRLRPRTLPRRVKRQHPHGTHSETRLGNNIGEAQCLLHIATHPLDFVG